MKPIPPSLTKSLAEVLARNPGHRDALVTLEKALEDGVVTDAEAFQRVLPTLGALMGRSAFVELSTTLSDPFIQSEVEMGGAARQALRDLASLSRSFELGDPIDSIQTPDRVVDAVFLLKEVLGRTIDEVMEARGATLQRDEVVEGVQKRVYQFGTLTWTRSTTETGDVLETQGRRYETFKLRVDERGRQTPERVIAQLEVQHGRADGTTRVTSNLSLGSPISVQYQLPSAPSEAPVTVREAYAANGTRLSQQVG